MNALEVRLRHALALPPADANFAARVRARIVTADWKARLEPPRMATAMPSLLTFLNLLAGCTLAGWLVQSLTHWLPAAAWWWVGLLGGLLLVGWNLATALLPARRRG